MTQPTMNDVQVMMTYAQSCVEIYRDWQTMGAAERRSQIQNSIRRVTASVTVPEFAFFFKAMSWERGGELNAQNWRLDINTAVSDSHNVTVADFIWFCSNLYHEARHGEQWYRCAQGVLAGDFRNDYLDGTNVDPVHVSRQMYIPLNVIQHAEARGKQTWRQYKEQLPVRRWFFSVWGNGRVYRAQILANPHVLTPGNAWNDSYLALPEEVDAYATQHAVEALLAPMLTTVVQKEVAAASTISTLRRNFEAATPTPLPAAIGVIPVPGRGRVAEIQAQLQRAPQQTTSSVVVTGAQRRVKELVAAHAALIQQQGHS